MANPRKFSEKIALHHQKQAEETAAFEQIMRDVANVTNKPDEVGLNQYGTSPDSGGGGGGGGGNAVHPQHQGAQVAHGRQGEGGSAPPSATMQTRGRPAGVGPMRARPMDRKIDTSPYGSTAYLSPPPDSSWRRTNSDSALHQSSVAPRDSSPHHHHHHHLHGGHGGHLGQLGGGQTLQHQSGGSPLHYPAGGYQPLHHDHPLSQGGGHMQQHQYSHSHQALNTALLHHGLRRDGNLDGMIPLLDANPNRPRSSCEVPRVPGIHLYPSAHDTGGTQIPVGSNTGSLPDLTSVHFPPQMHSSPLEREPPDQGACTPYSTSPASASPATLSPTSVATTGRSGPSPHHSPRHSPHGSPTTPHQYTNHQQNHLSVPNTNTNRYLHLSKGVALESSWMQGSYQQQCSPPSLHSSHSNINVASPTMGVSPVQVSSSNGCGYRSPRSPGSSPGGAGSGGGGNGGSGGNSNGPGGGDSPHYDAYAQSQDNYYINQTLHHFEHFSMTDTPSPSLNYINNVNTNQTQFIQTTLGGAEGDGGGGNVWAGGGPCLPGPAPNTPTTIPDIILTDFSNSTGAGDLGKDFGGSLSKDLSSSMSSHFESSFFPEDEGLRETLGTIDFDGLQMLTDPTMNIIPDPTTEEVFRQDRSV